MKGKNRQIDRKERKRRKWKVRLSTNNFTGDLTHLKRNTRFFPSHTHTKKHSDRGWMLLLSMRFKLDGERSFERREEEKERSICFVMPSSPLRGTGESFDLLLSPRFYSSLGFFFSLFTAHSLLLLPQGEEKEREREMKLPFDVTLRTRFHSVLRNKRQSHGSHYQIRK